jgi:hypothetical protein
VPKRSGVNELSDEKSLKTGIILLRIDVHITRVILFVVVVDKMDLVGKSSQFALCAPSRRFYCQVDK